MAVRGYVIPATLLRRGFGRIVDRALQQMLPGTGKHAVTLDLTQYLEGRVIRGISQQRVVTSESGIYGAGQTGA